MLCPGRFILVESVFKLIVLKHSIIHGMHSKDILIDSLTYLVIFERDDFILDQCAMLLIIIQKCMEIMFKLYCFQNY